MRADLQRLLKKNLQRKRKLKKLHLCCVSYSQPERLKEFSESAIENSKYKLQVFAASRSTQHLKAN